MSTKPLINLWASFLANEKLTVNRVGGCLMSLIKLCEELAKVGRPVYSPYKERLETRDLICKTAIDLGIDLAGIKFKGKLAMGRGLLDAWNKVYKAKFGDNFGTAGWFETKRRETVTKLSKDK